MKRHITKKFKAPIDRSLPHTEARGLPLQLMLQKNLLLQQNQHETLGGPLFAQAMAKQ
jgi:hypothetical protein